MTSKSSKRRGGKPYALVGDSADSSESLRLAAKSAKAGIAETTDAINLISAVTKGYGDTSIAAQQKVSDFAFETVKLGQTTFPELAASMGKVVPLAAALGVKQEELWAQMATLTGDTGGAAEVTTQLRATYQAILSPTKEMSDSMIKVTGELDKQGLLAEGKFTDAWRSVRARYVDAANNSRALKEQMSALEQQMASASGNTSLNDQLKALRLETEKSVLALKEQMGAIDTSTDAGKAQAQAIKDQIDQMKLLSDKREIEIQEQILAASGSQSLADQYRALQAESKNAEKAAEDLYKNFQEASAGMGTTIVQSVGLTDAMKMLTDGADGNSNTLTKMFGSVEALNAVLALSGGQADTFQQKLAAMKDVSGSTDEAFKAQTEGINAAGFTMEQVWAKVEVLTQRLGDGLAPTLIKLLDNPITPLLNRLADMVTWFANTDSGTQQWIITIAAVAAAVGPALVVIGTLISTLGTLVSGIGAVIGFITGGGGLLAAMGLLLNPIGLIVAAVGGLAYAWYNNWGGIRDWTDSVFGHIDISFGGLKDGMSKTWDAIKQLNQLGWEDYKAIGSAAMTSLESALGLHQGAIKEAFTSAWTAIKDAVMSVDWLGLGTAIIKGIIDGITTMASTLAQAAQNVAGGFWSSLKSFLGIDSSQYGSDGSSLPNSGYGGAMVPALAGGGVMNNIVVTVYVDGYQDPNSGSREGARNGVLEALRSVGLA